MGAAVADDGFDFSPGAQVPAVGLRGPDGGDLRPGLGGVPGQTTVAEILEANSEWHKSDGEAGRNWSTIFAPNLGEAFSRAVLDRMLGGGRKPLIQSFGTEPQVVVEHCLAANRIRKERDTWLTAVMAAVRPALPARTARCGCCVFQLRTHDRQARGQARRRAGHARCSSRSARVAVIFLIKLPFTGFWAWYLRASIVAPVDRLAVGQADLRAHGEGPARPLGRPAVRRRRRRQDPRGGARQTPTRPPPSELRQGLAKLTAEQQSNSVFYAGPKGILGMGTRWGSWQLAEELVPTGPGQGDPPVPQLGRHTRHPRPAADAGARPAAHRRLPHAVDQALDRLADRRERRRGRPGRAARTSTPSRSSPTRYSGSATSSSSAAATGTTWACSSRCGTASW